MLIAGCTDSGVSSTTEAGSTPAPTVPEITTTSDSLPDETTVAPSIPIGGVITVGAEQEPPVLNPLLPGGANDIVRAIGQAILAGAHDVDAATGQLRPDLVETLPTVRNGGVTVDDDGSMTVTWRVDPAARWSDGRPVTGADFGFTLDTLTELALDRNIIGYPQPALELVSGHSSTENAVTVTFSKTSVDYATLFEVVLPEHIIGDADAVLAYTDQVWPSAGPFVLDEWKHGDFIRLKRNPNYWRHDQNGIPLPYLDGVVFRFIPQPEDLAHALAAGDVDVIAGDATDIVAHLPQPGEAPAGLEIETARGPVFHVLLFGYDPEFSPPQNLLVDYRRALAALVDQDALSTEVFGRDGLTLDTMLGTTGEHPWSFIGAPPGDPTDLLAETCRQLERLCESDPIESELWVDNPSLNNRGQVATVLGGMFEAPGLRVAVELFEGFVDCFAPCAVVDLELVRLAQPSDPASLVAFFSGVLDRVVGFQRIADTDTARPFSQEAFARYQALVADMQTTADIDRVREIAVEAEQVLADIVAFIPLVSEPVAAASWTYVGGLEPEQSARINTSDIEQWFRADP